MELKRKAMEKNRENEMIYFFTQIPFLGPAVMEKMLERQEVFQKYLI